MTNAHNVLDDYVLKLFGKSQSRSSSSTSIFRVPTDTLLGLLEESSAAPFSADPASKSGSSSSAPADSSGVSPVGLSRLPSDPGGRSCTTCGLQFADATQQQEHCKSALHQSNLRRLLKGLSARSAVVSERAEKSGVASEAAEGYVSSESSGDSSEIEEEEEEEEELEDVEEEEEEEEDGTEQNQELANGQAPEDTAVVGARAGKPNSSVVTAAGAVSWGAFSAKDGLQATFRRAQSPGEWQFSVNSLLLQIPSSAPGAGGAVSAAASPWQSLGGVLQVLRTRPVWCVLILRSGKFAGAVFDGETVLEHKIFRRYTRRAKSGGAQSSYDKKGGKAQSAGAMMRRAGEEGLKADVSKLLQVWRSHLDAASAILVSVPVAMRTVLFEDNAPGAVLKKGDARILSVPFHVKQPTFAEVQVVHTRCSSVIFTKAGSEVGGGKRGSKVDAANSVSSAGPGGGELAEALELLSLEAARQGEETRKELWMLRARERERRREKASYKERRLRGERDQQQLGAAFDAQSCPQSAAVFAHLRAGDAGALKTLLMELTPRMGQGLQRHDTDGSTASVTSVASSVSGVDLEDLQSVLRRPEDLQRLSTPLHVAAELGCGEACSVLLEAGADPGAIDARGRTPYGVAKDKATRDSFRRSRARLEGDGSGVFAWKWDAAGVGPPLTEDAEVARKEALKEKEKEKKRRAKQRKQEQAEKAAQIQQDEKLAKEMFEQSREEAVANSVAAAGVCAQCGEGLYKVKVFALVDAKCCSADCVIKLRRRQAAEAAERRFSAGAK